MTTDREREWMMISFDKMRRTSITSTIHNHTLLAPICDREQIPRVATYTHALPTGDCPQRTQGAQCAHGSKGWNVCGAHHYGGQIDQRQLLCTFTIDWYICLGAMGERNRERKSTFDNRGGGVGWFGGGMELHGKKTVIG